MILTYTMPTSSGYLSSSDEYDDFGEDYDYEISDDDLREALSELLYELYFLTLPDNVSASVKKAIGRLILDNDLEGKLCEQFADKIKDYFKNKALASWGED